MQYRPDAATLLDAVAEVLDGVLADVPPEKQHGVRVAANLARLVGREARLGGATAAAERSALADLLGAEVTTVEAGSDRLAAVLRDGEIDDADFDAAVWRALVAVTARDLEIAKPGHTAWVGS